MAPKARTSWVRGRPRPHVSTRAKAPSRGAMTAPPRAGAPGKRNPAEGGAWVRGRPRPRVSTRAKVPNGAVTAPPRAAPPRSATPPKAGPGCAGVPARTSATRAKARTREVTAPPRQHRARRKHAGGTLAHPSPAFGGVTLRGRSISITLGAEAPQRRRRPRRNLRRVGAGRRSIGPPEPIDRGAAAD